MPSRSVLILQDDVRRANALAEAFRAVGWTVTAYTRFEDARRALNDETPDALLTDLRVGDFNGLHLALLLRLQAPQAAIIVISGYEDPVLRRDAEALQAEFLLKPVDVPVLVEQLSVRATLH